MRFHEKRFAEEYDRRLGEENYPGKLFQEIMREIGEFSSVIDCGAGSGLFTLPLLKAGLSVIAVEPSRPMVKILKRKIEKKGGLASPERDRLEIIFSPWENYEGREADACICIHALYGMEDPLKAVKKMVDLSQRVVILLNDREKPSDSMAARIRRDLELKQGYRRNDIDLKQILSSLSIPFRSRKIKQTRITRFSSIDREAEYYRHHLRLDNEDLSRIKTTLMNYVTKEDGFYISTLHYYDELFVF